MNESSRKNITANVASAIIWFAAVLLAGNTLWGFIVDGQVHDATPNREHNAPVRWVGDATDWQTYIANGAILGPSDADVNILVFGDYECPVSRYADQHIQHVREAYGARVAVVYRHYPLSYHPIGYVAATAAECANQQERFEEFHTVMHEDPEWIDHARPSGTGEASPWVVGILHAIASRAGVPDMKRFQACLGGKEGSSGIERDIAVGRELGVDGVPTVIVNRREFPVPPDSIQLRTEIERQIRP